MLCLRRGLVLPRMVPRMGALGLSPLSRSPMTSFVRTVKTSSVDWKPIRQSKASGSANERSSIYGKLFMGLLILMPIVSFGLGTWQVQRLRWKTHLISSAESKLALPPLELPPVLNADIASSQEFDYRRVVVRGIFRHDKEMYIGPRVRDGKDGYFLMTPLERPNGSTLLVKRGWIDRAHLAHSTRPMSLVEGEVEIECLLRTTPEKGMFTVEGKPGSHHYHFMDVVAMAEEGDCQPVLLEALLDSDSASPVRRGEAETKMSVEQMEKHGIPIGVVGKVEFRNTHFQYILTWYGLSIFTTFMLFSLIKNKRKPKSNIMRKLEHAKRNQ